MSEKPSNITCLKSHYMKRELIVGLRLTLLALAIIFLPAKALADTNNSVYRIYLDADQTNSTSSGQAIELGIRAALHEANWQLNGKPVELVLKDHHGSTARSRHHLKQFIEDQNALAVFGGLHSPPLISSRDFINKNNILTLVPWAAATPITRSPTDNNWIYRLSLDDSKAGKVIVNDAIKTSKFNAPFLLLEDTGWGKANQKTMTNALSELGHVALGIHFFQWGVGQHEARAILEKAVAQGADSFILVANAPEGITFAKAMLSLEPKKQKPIRSHWGITGGSFFNELGEQAAQALDLRFIQTRFSFFNLPQTERAQTALTSASKVKGVTKLEPADIKAPAGFIHAYDLTKLFIAAANDANLSGQAKADAQKIKEKLESQSKPVEGLIKTYQQAFKAYRPSEFDAHEALTQDDFVMAHFDEDGNIRLLN